MINEMIMTVALKNLPPFKVHLRPCCRVMDPKLVKLGHFLKER